MVRHAPHHLFNHRNIPLNLPRDFACALRRDDFSFFTIENDATGRLGISASRHVRGNALVRISGPAKRENIFSAATEIDVRKFSHQFGRVPMNALKGRLPVT